MLPMSLTLSITYRCNSHCKTCNIHNKTANELSLEEWGKVAETLRGNVFWLTFSGGEPFLRKDIVELIKKKEILENIEKAVDRCQNTATVIEGILIKNL